MKFTGGFLRRGRVLQAIGTSIVIIIGMALTVHLTVTKAMACPECAAGAGVGAGAAVGGAALGGGVGVVAGGVAAAIIGHYDPSAFDKLGPCDVVCDSDGEGGDDVCKVNDPSKCKKAKKSLKLSVASVSEASKEKPSASFSSSPPSSDVSPPSDSYSSSDLSSVTGIATASVIEEDYPIKKELLGEEWKYRKAVMDALACDLHCQTPYKMGGRWKVPLSCSCEGSRELGRDCSGLVAGAYRQGVCLLKGFYKSSFDRLSFLETDAKGLSIYFAKNGAFIHPKSGVEPSPGDVIFFKNTYKKGVSHVGIFVGKNKNGETVIIHASSSGVTSEPISDYLKDKVAGYGNISRLYSKHVMTFHP